jgi:hypothetical protein
MELHFDIDQADADRLRRACDRWGDHDLVRQRIELNVGPPATTPPTRDQVWEGLVLALTSSQQRSGPGSRLWDLWQSDPSPLSLAVVRAWKPAVAHRVAGFLKEWGGIRCYNRIGGFIETNLRILFDEGGIDRLDGLTGQLWGLRLGFPDWDDRARHREREICSEVLGLGLKGIGNKQCRNWLQDARLLRYEIPLDSRVLKFLRPMMPGVPLEQDLLGHESYYHFIEDAVQELCRRAEMFPCVADAVMFLHAGSGT